MVSSKEIATRLVRKFQPFNERVEFNGNDLWLSRRLEVEEVCNLEANLECIVDEWVELWKRAGGIERVFEE